MQIVSDKGFEQLKEFVKTSAFRRVHITLETSWSADVQMQTFGRTHRSNQLFAPEYVLMSTDLGGEKRFLSTIAKRLGSLGALTKGDREQAGGGNLMQFDYENKYGLEAAKRMVSMLAANSAELMSSLPLHLDTKEEQNGLQILYTMGIAKRQGNVISLPEKAIENLEVSRFLNRLLMLDVATQNAIFDAFGLQMERMIHNDKQLGLFDDGVKDIEGDNIRFAKQPSVVSTDQASGAKTMYYHIHADTPTAPVTLREIEERNRVIKVNGFELTNLKTEGVFYQNTSSKNIIYTEYKASRADAKSGSLKQFHSFARPGGWQSHLLSEDELMQKYVPVKLDQERVFKNDEVMTVENWWKKEVENTPPTKVSNYHLIAGAVLPVWQRLSSSNESGNTMSLKTVRIETVEGERVVGVQIPSHQINRVLRDLGVDRSYKSPEEIFDAVMETNEMIDLVGGIKLRRALLKKQQVIQIMNISIYQQTEFKNFGALQEFINFESKTFIPKDKENGIVVLSKMLERYPAVDNGVSEQKEENSESRKPETESFAEKLKDKIDGLTGGGLPDGMLAKLTDDKTPFAEKAALLRGQPLHSYWWMMNASVNDRGQVLLSPASFEFVRTVYKESFGNEIKNFDGLFNDEEVTERFFETLDRKVQDKTIYSEAIADLTSKLALGRDMREDGILVLLTDESASNHEEVHVFSYVASLGKSLEERHGLFDELINDPNYQKAKTILTEKQKTNSDGILVEECFAYCYSGDGDEIGLTPEEAADYSVLWFRSFAAKNGTISIKEFKELTNESAEIRQRAYSAIATDIIRRQLETEFPVAEESQVNREPGRTIQNASDRGFTQNRVGEKSTENQLEENRRAVETENARQENRTVLLNNALETGKPIKAGMLYKTGDDDVSDSITNNDLSPNARQFVDLWNKAGDWDSSDRRRGKR